MLETVKIVSYIVWSGVGVACIGVTIWGAIFYSKLYKGLLTKEDEKAE